METVIDDFWDTLSLESPNIDYSILYPLTSDISTPTVQSHLLVSIFRNKSQKYVVMLTNSEQAKERDSAISNLSLIDIPGHITTFRTYDTFKEAINSHYRALSKLD